MLPGKTKMVNIVNITPAKWQNVSIQLKAPQATASGPINIIAEQQMSCVARSALVNTVFIAPQLLSDLSKPDPDL